MQTNSGSAQSPLSCFEPMNQRHRVFLTPAELPRVGVRTKLDTFCARGDRHTADVCKITGS